MAGSIVIRIVRGGKRIARSSGVRSVSATVSINSDSTTINSINSGSTTSSGRLSISYHIRSIVTAGSCAVSSVWVFGNRIAIHSIKLLIGLGHPNAQSTAKNFI